MAQPTILHTITRYNYSIRYIKLTVRVWLIECAVSFLSLEAAGVTLLRAQRKDGYLTSV